MSAILVSRLRAENNASATFSLGCTRQWLAADFAKQEVDYSTHEARPFAYRGSVGPLAIAESVQLQIHQVANLLAQEFSIRGVWGIDFVLDADDQVWAVDFNPRITASAELFESAVAGSTCRFQSVIDLHLSACRSIRPSDQAEFKKLADDQADVLGVKDCETKRIVYFTGPDAVEIDQAKWEQLSRYHVPSFFQSNQTGASIADVPRLGDRIASGRPLLTLRSRGKTVAAAMDFLDELFDAVQDCADGIS